jgi:hypothetical protein
MLPFNVKVTFSPLNVVIWSFSVVSCWEVDALTLMQTTVPEKQSNKATKKEISLLLWIKHLLSELALAN